MEKAAEISLTIVLMTLVFTLVYRAARRNNRDRPWLWGSGAALLCPGFLIFLVVYLLRGKMLTGFIAFLCPQCRHAFSQEEVQQKTCAQCGRQV